MSLSWSLLPGPAPSRRSAMRSIRLAGTNTSSVTMVLLPVARMPAVNQVSATV
jgi:hypothetical protein